MLKFSLSTPNIEPLFFALQTPLQNFSDLWPDFVRIIQDSVGAQITGGGRGPGGAYPPLSTDYAKWKAKHFPGAAILQRTGRLLGSFFGGPGFIFETTPKSMRYGTGTPVEYALYH